MDPLPSHSHQEYVYTCKMTGTLSCPQVNASEVELDYVLYTDCDVLFESDINTCTAPRMPSVMYVGGESMPQDIANTGELK